MLDVTLDVLGVLFFLFAVFREIKYAKRRKKKRKALRELDSFIVDVRHFFYQSGLASWAVREATGSCGPELAPYAERIAEAVESGEENGVLAMLEGCIVGKYLKIFYLLMSNVEEYGDPGGDGGVLSKLLEIRMDISTEQRLIVKKGHLFMGLVMTTAVPILTMPAIVSWACQTLPQLSDFYHGKVGILVRIAIMIATMLSYSAVVSLREGRDLTSRVHRAEHYITERTFIGKLIERVIVKNYTRALRHTDMLRRLGEKINVNILYFRQFQASVLGLVLIALVYSDSRVLEESGIGDIALFLIVPVICFFMPLVGMKLKKILSSDSLEEEIAELQLAASMLSDTGGMTVMGMLEVMEQFSRQLAPSISGCINDCAISEENALEKLGALEINPHFSRIVESLAAADDLGLEGAFEEINDDRKKFREYRDQENEYQIEDKSKLAMMLAILPGLLILFVYLLIPFMSEALGLFDSYALSLEESL